MSGEQLRIRPDNGTVRELKIPKEILEKLERIVANPFSEGGATRVEYYCNSCITRVYSREQVL